ncbi:MAG: glycine--tRNA ligase subunit beta [Holosporales bacterium]
MPDLLLEVLSEEIPDGLQASAAKQVEALLPKALGEAGLSYNTLTVHHTPRRLVVTITELPAEKPAQSLEKRGPRADAPAAALEGFLSANKISIDALEKRTTDKGTFYFLNQHSPAQPLASILPLLLTNVLLSITWAKSQTWGAYTLKWGRPVRSVLAFLDNKPLPGSLSLSEAVSISFGTATVGARQHASPARTVESPAEYRSLLNEQGIIVDAAQRRTIIQEQGNALATAHNLTAEWHEGVLAEVVGLVETPVPILGTFDAAFLNLPPELLVSVMRTHQRYFPLYKDGVLSNHFLVVTNNQKPDTHNAIIDGNQKVLRARFSDAQFYWESDKKITLEEHRQKLRSMVFHEKLGSVFDKSERLIKLLPNAFEAHAAKADLASGTVREFPELQGIIGGYLINEAPGREDSATAVREHYLPLGPNSPLPSSTQGKTLALFDKMDSFYWLLAAGERPTGSRDPLGLRRLASAIVRLIDARPENDLYFPAAWQRCNDSNPELAKKLHLDHDKIATLATDLLLERAKDFLEERERDRVPPGVFLAVLNSDICGSRQQFSRAILTNAQTFARALETKEGQTILALYKRVTNILHIEEKKDKKRHDNAVDESLLKTEPQEAQTLYTEIRKAQNDPYFTRPQFYAYYFMYMADLAPIAANFFDAVFINDPDPARRANRLGLLSLLRTLLESYADFSQIEG